MECSSTDASASLIEGGSFTSLSRMVMTALSYNRPSPTRTSNVNEAVVSKSRTALFTYRAPVNGSIAKASLILPDAIEKVNASPLASEPATVWTTVPFAEFSSMETDPSTARGALLAGYETPTGENAFMAAMN